MTAYTDYFYLTKGSVSIDPWNDAEVYFGSKQPQHQILERINQDFVAARGVPKFFLLGRYGGGKTHSLAHIKYVLEADELARDFPTEPIYLEIAPIKARDAWVTVHRRILDAIGLNSVKKAVSEVVSKHGSVGDAVGALEKAGSVRFGEESLRSSQVQIFRNLLFGGQQEVLSWEWLKGKALTTSDASMLGTETNLTGPSDYVAALLNIAALHSAGTGKKLVLLMDEGEALGSLAHPDSVEEFTFALRRLVSDDNNVLGLVITVESDAGMGSAPLVLSNEAIRGRIGFEQGIIDLADLVLDANDAREFVTDVLGRVIDQDAARRGIETNGWDTEPEFFPFTQDGVDEIAEFVSGDPSRSSPRQILAIVAGAVGLQWDRREQAASPIIQPDTIAAALYPDEQ